MKEEDFDSSQSSSIQDDEISAKRQKLDETNMSSLRSSNNGSTLPSLEERLAVLQIKLSHTTAMVTHFQDKKEHIEQVLEEELDNLKVEMEVDKKLVKQLEIHLATERRCSQQNYDSQESVDFLNFQQRARMREKIVNLLSENYENFYSSQEGETDGDRRLEAAKLKMVIELERMLEDSTFLGFDVEDVEFEGDMMKIKRLETSLEDNSLIPASVHGDEEVDQKAIILEDEEGVLNTISGLQQIETLLSEKSEELRSRLDDMRKEHERVLQICEELKRMGENMMKKNVVIEDDNPSEEVPGPIVDGLHDAPVDKGPDEVPNVVSDKSKSLIKDNGDPPGAEQLPENLEIAVSDYCVLASDQRWFEIDWLEQYRQEGSQKYSCNKCSMIMNTRVQIQDHIWVSHFGGGFKCPHCPNPSRILKRRSSIGKHVRSIHPDCYRPKK